MSFVTLGSSGRHQILGATSEAAKIRDALNSLDMGDRLFPRNYRIPYSSLTGVTAETLVASLTIPGGVLQAGDFLVLDTFFGPLATPVGTMNLRLNLSNTNNQNICTASNTGQNRFFRRVIAVQSGALILHPDDINGHPSGFGVLTRTVTANLASATLLRWFITPSSASDTWIVPFALLQHIRPSLAYSS